MRQVDCANGRLKGQGACSRALKSINVVAESENRGFSLASFKGIWQESIPTLSNSLTLPNFTKRVSWPKH
jgi:hypothetical protein